MLYNFIGFYSKNIYVYVIEVINIIQLVNKKYVNVFRVLPKGRVYELIMFSILTTHISVTINLFLYFKLVNLFVVIIFNGINRLLKS